MKNDDGVPTKYSADYQDVLDFLSQVDSYQDDSSQVTHISTHISDVFLTDRFAYKIKKRVTFDFLDYGSLEQRKTACDAELSLNRRLADKVYIAVTPIFRDEQGSLNFKSGIVIEYAVKMRRLDENLFLDHLMQKGNISSSHMQALAEKLIAFYRTTDKIEGDGQQYLLQLKQHIFDNGQSLSQYISENSIVRQIHSSQMLFLYQNQDLLQERFHRGFVVDGHGDLRPEHICFEETPQIFDCIEFNRDYRSLDIVDELAFFAEECEFMGRADIGETILNIYRESMEDPFTNELVCFFKSYRASVRAKVAAIRQSQLSQSNVQIQQDLAKHMEMAYNYSQKIQSPTVIVVGGLMGSGKSTLAAALARELFITDIHTDLVRKQIFSKLPTDQEFDQGKYSAASREEVYQSLVGQGEALLSKGESVVVDGTFSSKLHRQQWQALAQSFHAMFVFIFCKCPDDIAIQRIQQRPQDEQYGSEARADLYHQQWQAYNFDFSELPHIEIDTTKSLSEQLSLVLTSLAHE